MIGKPKGLAILLAAHGAPKKEGEEDGDGMDVAMQDLARALKTDDWAGAAAAFHSAFQIAESKPHEENAE